MAVENGHGVRGCGEASFKSFDCLWSKRNFRDQNNSAAVAIEGVPDRLQINLGLAAAGDTVEQDRTRIFRSGQRLLNFPKGQDLLRVQRKVPGGDKLLVAMRVALNCFLAQFDQATFGQSA